MGRGTSLGKSSASLGTGWMGISRQTMEWYDITQATKVLHNERKGTECGLIDCVRGRGQIKKLYA